MTTYRTITDADPLWSRADFSDTEDAPADRAPLVIGSGYEGTNRARLVCSACQGAVVEEARYYPAFGRVVCGWVCVGCGHWMAAFSVGVRE